MKIWPAWLKTAAESLAASVFFSFPATAGLLAPNRSALYHATTGSVIPAALADLLLLWLLLALLFHFLNACRASVRASIWSAIFVLSTFFVAIATKGIFLDKYFRFWEAGLPAFVFFFLLGAYFFQPQKFSVLIDALRIVLCFVALFGINVLVQLLIMLPEARYFNIPPLRTQTSVLPDRASHGRIIWIIFDELDFRQAYDHRPQQISLPAFDALRSQSVFFTHTTATSNFTEYAIPSLITGTFITQTRSSIQGWPSYYVSTTKQWQTFDPGKTVFADAVHSGYHSAVAGWAIPYCRILRGLLDQCFWRVNEKVEEGRPTLHSLLHNMASPYSTVFAHLIGRLTHYRHQQWSVVQIHSDDYVALLSASDSLLRDPSLDLVYLHQPLPHLPGFFDRNTQEMHSINKNYFDNLYLADITLAHFRQILVQQGQWDSSTIIVMGDHAWRTFLVRGEPGWTPEEEAASNGGVFDPRPVYLVKLPYQHSELTIDRPYSAINTRDLFDHLFTQQITTPEQLAAWAAQKQ